MWISLRWNFPWAASHHAKLLHFEDIHTYRFKSVDRQQLPFIVNRAAFTPECNRRNHRFNRSPTKLQGKAKGWFCSSCKKVAQNPGPLDYASYLLTQFSSVNYPMWRKNSVFHNSSMCNINDQVQWRVVEELGRPHPYTQLLYVWAHYYQKWIV